MNKKNREITVQTIKWKQMTHICLSHGL
jgi:hypothetical protein